jgi:hypothetical protein
MSSFSADRAILVVDEHRSFFVISSVHLLNTTSVSPSPFPSPLIKLCLNFLKKTFREIPSYRLHCGSCLFGMHLFRQRRRNVEYFSLQSSQAKACEDRCLDHDRFPGAIGLQFSVPNMEENRAKAISGFLMEARRLPAPGVTRRDRQVSDGAITQKRLFSFRSPILSRPGSLSLASKSVIP